MWHSTIHDSLGRHRRGKRTVCTVVTEDLWIIIVLARRIGLRDPREISVDYSARVVTVVIIGWHGEGQQARQHRHDGIN